MATQAQIHENKKEETIMSWDFQEFQNICLKRNLPDTTVYQDTLSRKEIRAKYFGKKAQLILTYADLNSSITGGEFEDNDWIRVFFKYESNIEAALQAAHSMTDTIAQIINVVILNSHFSEGDVSLKKVSKKLSSPCNAPIVSQAIQQLLNSKEFNYINSFVNTIKHRSLVDAEYRIEFGKETCNRAGIKFREFKYCGNTYPVTWGDDIISKYIPKIIDLIWDIGNALNEHLKK